MERGHSFPTAAEREIVGDIKDNLCDIAWDVDTEMKETTESSDEETNYELPDATGTEMGTRPIGECYLDVQFAASIHIQWVGAARNTPKSTKNPGFWPTENRQNHDFLVIRLNF